MEYTEFALVYKALSDVTRLQIIDMLSCGELCACKILEKFNITQPTLSYHMKVLIDSGIVLGVRDGAWMRYNLVPKKIKEITDFWQNLTLNKADCICKKEICKCK